MFWVDVLTLCMLLGSHPWFLYKCSGGYKSVTGNTPSPPIPTPPPPPHPPPPKKRLKLEVVMLDHRNEVIKLSFRPGSRGRDSMLKQEVFKLLPWCWPFSVTWGKSHLLGKNTLKNPNSHACYFVIFLLGLTFVSV